MKRYRSFLWLIVCLTLCTNVQAVNEAPDPPTPGYNGPLCEGDGNSLMLMTNPPATGGPFTFLWTGPNGFTSTDENPVINNPTTDNAGLYTVTILDFSGAASGSIAVTINETPDQPFITAPSNVVCDRANISLTAPSYSGSSVEYIWTTPDGTTINSPVFPINGATIADQGPYSVQAIVDGCPSAMSPDFDLLVELAPQAADDMDSLGVDRSMTTINILVNDDLSATFGGYTINLTSEPGFGTLVDLGDGSYDYTPNENFVGLDGFTYELCSQTCETLCTTATVTIRVTGGMECAPPKVITPNGDGYNDTFKINCLDFHPNAELTVFNRYGDKVYNGQNYQNDWKGTFNGEDLPVGTYYYVLKLENADDVSGYIMLTR